VTPILEYTRTKDLLQVSHLYPGSSSDIDLIFVYLVPQGIQSYSYDGIISSFAWPLLAKLEVLIHLQTIRILEP
jgi:hypothetical protein